MPTDVKTNNSKYWLILGFIVSLISYYFLLYQTPREDFFGILLNFTILGLCYLVVLRYSQHAPLKILLIGAVLLRMTLLWAVPELSDDFYRFIWDGKLWQNGINPFAHLPAQLMQDPGFSSVPLHQQLFEGLNSPDYFTIYPPISQYIFVLSTYLFPDSILGNIVVMRVGILLCEVGTIFLLPKVLAHFKRAPQQALIYAWNPLVIIELTGNLHFEAVMIFFLLIAIWLVQTDRWYWSAVALGAAVSTKLIPLVFLPLLWGRFPFKKLVLYYALTGLTIALCFLPMLNPGLIQGMSSSLSLYFQKFEFNASVYYLVREIGYAVKGYNVIEAAGKYLALATFLAVIGLSWYSHKKITWPQAMVWALLIYLLFTTTVHPWYITPLLFLSTFGRFRFPLVWSILVILSYAGYQTGGYSENLWLVATEYLAVLGVLYLELRGSVVNLFSKKQVTTEHESIS